MPSRGEEAAGPASAQGALGGAAGKGLGLARGCRGAGWAATGGGIADQPLLAALCPDWNEVKEEAKGSQRRT
ncbi:hypothetical protein MJ257_01120 [Paenibacillus timonensis]|uniref:Uncharacterized protein n=2 Tax=Paenibacillus timonensis TaxID=225915 RepID=A0ABW3S7B1_9BACL|nr:hypothetical protein [Paenibacillus timonensis]